jgi:hypothetical protein
VIRLVILTFKNILRSMKQESNQIENSLTGAGWVESFRLGLHAFHELQLLVLEMLNFLQLRSWCLVQSRDAMYDKVSSLCETYVNSLPSATCLAMRHTTLISLEMLKVIDSDFLIRRIDPNMQPIPTNLFADKTMRLAMEQSPFQIIADSVLSFTDTPNVQEETDVSTVRIVHQKLQRSFKKVHDGGATSACSLPRCDHFVTRRIREEILGRWDHFVKDNPQTVADLQRDGVNDIEALRALVESFVDGFEE